MRILILGGTVFLGRALTDAALARGHRVTHFNRGRSSAPDARVETVTGDRTQSLEALAGREWDAVVDTSGYLPQVVGKSARALRDATRRYVFVSSISVYAGPGFAEDAAVQPPPDPLPDAMTMEAYGALKAACEGVVRESFGDRATLVRPGLIVGPHDPTDRFTWWPARVARGGRVAAPGRPSRTVQFIDVRDLARWMVELVQRGAAGTFNATGPRAPVEMSRLLEACRSVSGSDAAFEWIDEATLAERGVKPWTQMPLWVPDADPHASGCMNVPIGRALATGLAFTPLEETIADTHAWSRTRPADYAWKAGLAAERELTVLTREGARA
ncbi:MAG: NAD-dependent epimerase/dehydratase family protein [Usitatibacter sp.]